MEKLIKFRSIFLLFILALLIHVTVVKALSESSRTDDDQSTFPVGDARRCPSMGDKNLFRLEVLPGGGWDNIRNKEKGMVMKLNYSKCLTTDDGRYLVPDEVYTIPTKSSRVDTYAELFVHWGNFSSTTSGSINAHAGLSFKGLGISGKYSKEYEQVKTQQFFDKAMTTRTQIRYVRYIASAQPNFALDDRFKARLKRIAANIVFNETELATYESQMLVRDFGTHVITSVDMGAALVQVDHIKESFFKSHVSDKKTGLKAASASFLKIFDGGFDHGTSVSKTVLDEYENNRTNSEIVSYGGPVFLPNNISAAEWSQSLANDMVALDRSGDPIYLLISTTSLPELPASTVYQLHAYVKAAVELYYEHNTYRGCTERDAPNFSFIANVNDGSCGTPIAKFTFGGVFQTCSSNGDASHCDGLQQVNPLTGTFSCPDNYQAVLLQSAQKPFVVKQRSCHRCKLLHHCCHDISRTEEANYTAYWCSPSDHTGEKTGFLFGGLFTSATYNPTTQSMSCPPKFYALRLLQDLSVCVTGDYELGLKDALPLAGFFSCKSGNPLALKTSTYLKSSDSQHSLLKYMEYDGLTSWPRECPPGYSQHLAVVDNGCQVNYCIKTGALSSLAVPKVKRPPFMPLPKDTSENDTEFSFSGDGSDWNSRRKMTEDYPDQSSGLRRPADGADKNGSGFLSAGGVSGIAIAGILLCFVVGVVAVITYRRRRKYRNLLGTYGTLSYDGGTEDTNLLHHDQDNMRN